jgi:hypothetical protein
VALWLQGRGQAPAVAEQSGQRAAILAVGAFILVGLVLLTLVNEGQAREAAMSAEGTGRQELLNEGLGT